MEVTLFNAFKIWLRQLAPTLVGLLVIAGVTFAGFHFLAQAPETSGERFNPEHSDMLLRIMLAMLILGPVVQIVVAKFVFNIKWPDLRIPTVKTETQSTQDSTAL